MLRLWFDDFGHRVIPDHLSPVIRKDGLLDRRYKRQNAEFIRWAKR
jgi:hypothetical protein